MVRLLLASLALISGLGVALAADTTCPGATAMQMAQGIKAATDKVGGTGLEIDDVANFNKVMGDLGIKAPEGTITILVGVAKGVGIAAINKDGCVVGLAAMPRPVWDAIADKLGGVKFIKAKPVDYRIMQSI